MFDDATLPRQVRTLNGHSSCFHVQSSAMDLLSDLLQQAGFQRRLLDLRRIADGDALRFPCERSIGLHVVLQGPLWLHAPALPEPLALAAGDLVLMARGCTHVLAATPRPAAARTRELAAVASAPAAGAGVISGAYQLWNTPVHPFFTEMPPWFVLRAAQLPRLGPLSLAVSLLAGELQQPALGSDTVVHGLMDVVFTWLLRAMVAEHAPAGAGWSHAVQDPAIRDAVALLHADCAHPWTLESLAARCGLSRSVLAERFRAAMGDTPLAYLRTVRMQRAMRLLADTGQRLEDVALQVGYQDAFGFSKVFKRVVGVSPGEFRRRDQAERSEAWRFAG